MSETIEGRLKALGVELPAAAAPAANYLPYARSGQLLFTAGQLPMKDGKLAMKGLLGRDLDVEAGREAAKLCAVNVLAQAKAALKDLEKIVGVVKITVYVASAPGFTEQHLVANGASDFLVAALGGRGKHARTAAEMAALRIGGTADHAPSLREMLDLVAGRVPLIIELKGIPGHDDGLVAAVAGLLRAYPGKAAIMSFDHWLVRRFPDEAAGILAGLTATGALPHEIEAHFSMLGNGISFASFSYVHLPNPFVTFLRERLSMPVITWTVRDAAAVQATFAHGDQMTFEGFDPDAVA